jgi:hypothetical protein
MCLTKKFLESLCLKEKSTSDFSKSRTSIHFAFAKSSVLVVSWTFLITFCALTSIGTSFLAHLKCLKTKKKILKTNQSMVKNYGKQSAIKGLPISHTFLP